MLFSARDWLGVGLGFLLIGVVLAVASLLDRKDVCDAFVTRKIVHIGVGHWWFVAWYFHASVAPALVGPIVFAVANFGFYRFSRVRALGHEQSGDNFGIVLYPLSLIVLVVASWSGPLSQEAAAAGVLIMAWGDGLAAIVGRAVSKRNTALRDEEARAGDSASNAATDSQPARIRPAVPGVGNKTMAGSAAMFAASLAVVFLLKTISGTPATGSVAAVAGVAAVSTFMEAFTPWGLDNVTVPLASAAAYMMFVA